MLEGEVGQVHLCTNEAVFDYTQTLGKKAERNCQETRKSRERNETTEHEVAKSDAVDHLHIKVEALTVDIDHLKSNKSLSSLVQQLQRQLNQQQMKIQQQNECYKDLIREVDSLKNDVAQKLSSGVKGPEANPEANRYQYALTAESSHNSLTQTAELQLLDPGNESKILKILD